MKTEIMKQKIKEYEETMADVSKINSLIAKLSVGGNVDSFTLSVYPASGEGELINISSKGMENSLYVFCADLRRCKERIANRLLGEIKELANEGVSELPPEEGGAGHDVEIEGEDE